MQQVLQQEAYPAIRLTVGVRISDIPGLSAPKWEKTCPRCSRTAVQIFTPMGKAPAEKSVTVQKGKTQVSRPYYRMAD